MAACSNKAGIAGPTGSTGTTETTTTIPPTTGTGNTGNPGYFNLGEVKTYTAQIAASFQDTGFRWTYNKSQGDWEANTGGNFCMLSMTNSQQSGETSAQVDNIDISCGLPLSPSSVNRGETNEATGLILGVTKQFVSQAASAWIGQEITKAASGGSAADNQTFGPVAVGVTIGTGTFMESLLSQGA